MKIFDMLTGNGFKKESGGKTALYTGVLAALCYAGGFLLISKRPAVQASVRSIVALFVIGTLMAAATIFVFLKHMKAESLAKDYETELDKADKKTEVDEDCEAEADEAKFDEREE